MENWKQLKDIGIARFILIYGLIVTVLFVVNYYLFKFLFSSFQFKFNLFEFILVLIISLLIGSFVGVFAWRQVEKNSK
jgi:ABC-type antimicrobial peptide transport system permease subunit